MDSSENYAVIVAAGKGLRMGTSTKKQYLRLEGIPVLARTIDVFETCDTVHEIILVVPGQDREFCKKQILEPFGFSKKIHLVKGGKERQDSVLNGLRKVQEIKTPQKEAVVMIHDGVRPFVSHGIIEMCLEKAIEFGACIPAVRITDTVKEVAPGHMIKRTVDRAALYTAQTPQTFRLDLILQAFDHAIDTAFSGTDDAALVEHSGHKVVIVNGSKSNIKITTPEDLDLGKFLLGRG